MSTKTLTGSIVGLNAELVEVEADARGLLTRFFVVGLPDSMVQEARERVKSALKHSGLTFPRGTIVINLAGGSPQVRDPLRSPDRDRDRRA